MNLLPNKRGVDNNMATDAGLLSSGQMQANGGTLHAQRQQAPYEHVGAKPKPPPLGGGLAQPTMGGPLNGGAVQGAQFKTTAQSMSPGAASYLSIPSFGAPQAQATGTMLPAKQAQAQVPPMQLQMQQPAASFFAPGGVPNFGKPLPGSPQQTTPQYNGQQAGVGGIPTDPSAFGQTQAALSPVPQPNQQGFNPSQEIDALASFYDQGGQWDANTRLTLQNQMTGNTRAQMLRDSMAGRGSNLGQIGQDRANLDSMASYEAQRGQLQQQAERDAYGMKMDLAERLNATKTGLVQLALASGMTFDDADFNRMASEVLGQYGEMPTEDNLLSKLQDGTKNEVKRTPQDITRAVSMHMDSTWQNETAAAAYIEGLSAAELKACAADGTCKSKLTKALDDSYGEDYDRIAAALQAAGISPWED